MNKLLYSLVAIPLVFGVVGCSLTAPVTPVPDVLNSTIETTFVALNIGLTALAFVPGLPAIIVKEAQAVNMALQAAYAEYKRDPMATNASALMNSAIQAAQAFMNNQAKPALKALHTKGLAQ